MIGLHEALALANEAARASDDPDTQVGCVIGCVDGTNVTSANKLPIGVVPLRERTKRPAKYDWIQHAEQRAIAKAARLGISTAGATMGLPWFPCPPCAQAIVTAGIAVLVCNQPEFDHPKWGAGFHVASTILEEGGVRVVYASKSEED